MDDDVHAWDTHHERLALADRFGLVLTFPQVDRARYLTLVAGLAEMGGLTLAGGLARDGRALRRTRQRLPGRTARQFVTEGAQRCAGRGRSD